jgi:2-phospho-L-lactate/phosphoenolpyruvate guanylyltransferase
MRIAAVIPVKTASQCKQRLSAVLEARVRRKLVEVMLSRVVNAVRGVDAISSLYIVTNDRSFVPDCARQIPDSGGGLNVALTAAARKLSDDGVDAMLILPGDIPFITGDDVAGLVALCEPQRMIIVSDVLRSGTNALLLAPPALVSPRFGSGSLHAHLRAALEANLRAVVHENPNIARDIDEPRDVAWLVENSRDAGFDFLRCLPAALAG